MSLTWLFCIVEGLLVEEEGVGDAQLHLVGQDLCHLQISTIKNKMEQMHRKEHYGLWDREIAVHIY